MNNQRDWANLSDREKDEYLEAVEAQNLFNQMKDAEYKRHIKKVKESANDSDPS